MTVPTLNLDARISNEPRPDGGHWMVVTLIPDPRVMPSMEPREVLRIDGPGVVFADFDEQFRGFAERFVEAIVKKMFESSGVDAKVVSVRADGIAN